MKFKECESNDIQVTEQKCFSHSVTPDILTQIQSSLSFQPEQ